jgi:hypothetical protein
MIDTVYPATELTLTRALQDKGQIVLIIGYLDAKHEPKTEEEVAKCSRSLAVRMSFQQAAEFGSELWRTAEQLTGDIRPQ